MVHTLLLADQSLDFCPPIQNSSPALPEMHMHAPLRASAKHASPASNVLLKENHSICGTPWELAGGGTSAQ